MMRSILDAIGHTPLVQLDKLAKDFRGRLWMKLEYALPGLSKKDRVALRMIEDAEKDGRLQKGQPVIELTSGNMGTGLSIVCKARGYRFIAVISKGNSVERVKMMKAFGAEVVLVDQMPGAVPGQVSGEDLALVDQEAQRLTKELGGFRADQFNNPSTYRAFELDMAEELFAQLEGPVDAFADLMGTGGSFVGLTKALKRKFPGVKCFGVEPVNAGYYSGTHKGDGKHVIQGGGYNMELPFFTEDFKKLVDGYISVTDEEAINTARALAREEGIFAGYSSGANACAALKLLGGEFAGGNVLVIAPDSGTKYLSGSLWD